MLFICRRGASPEPSTLLRSGRRRASASGFAKLRRDKSGALTGLGLFAKSRRHGNRMGSIFHVLKMFIPRGRGNHITEPRQFAGCLQRPAKFQASDGSAKTASPLSCSYQFAAREADLDLLVAPAAIKASTSLTRKR